MWTVALSFLKGNVINILLGLLVAGAGWYIVATIQENGALKERIESKDKEISEWSDRFDQLQADREVFSEYDDWLAEQQQMAVNRDRTFSRQVENLRNDISGLKDYLDMQPPPDFRQFLCVSGLIEPRLCEDDSGEVSYELREDPG